jgi:predicted nucleic acid-binding protein
MTFLVDSGPIIGVFDVRDYRHRDSLHLLSSLPDGNLVTTWPCLAEILHILGRKAGWNGQNVLWRSINDGKIEVADASTADLHRCRELMEIYADLPMDLADASLVAYAERTSVRHVLTFDSHFRAYRLANGDSLTVSP